MLPSSVPDLPSTGGPPPSRRELMATWGWVVGGIGLAAALGEVEPSGLLRRNLGGVAALLFVLVPDLRIRARGEAWLDYGLPGWGFSDGRTWRAWGRGVAAGIGVSLV